MSFINELARAVDSFIENSDKPVVVFSAMWPLFRFFECAPNLASEIVLKMLMNTVGNKRALLMPAFANGYKNGICNLDTESSKNGVLSELFRQTKDVKRTLSAFFPFSVLSQNEALVNRVINLNPQFAWGEGSLYEWMEQENVHFIMLGVHPTTCSYLHRMEWLVRDSIDYRYNKPFNGTLIREGEKIEVEENVFVRSLKPEAINDFTTIYEKLKTGGMDVMKIKGVSIAHMRANDMKKVFLSLIECDPYIVLANRQDFGTSPNQLNNCVLC